MKFQDEILKSLWEKVRIFRNGFVIFRNGSVIFRNGSVVLRNSSAAPPNSPVRAPASSRSHRKLPSRRLGSLTQVPGPGTEKLAAPPAAAHVRKHASHAQGKPA